MNFAPALKYTACSVIVFVMCFSLLGSSFVFAQETQATLNTTVDMLIADEGALAGQTILIKYKNKVTQDDVKADFTSQASLFTDGQDQNITITDETTALVQYTNQSDLRGLLKTALSQPDVEYAQPLYRYTSFATPYNPTANPTFSSQWYLQDQASGINLPSALGTMGEYKGVDCAISQLCGGDPSIKVAVIDSGVNLDGVDLASNSVDTANGARYFYNPDNTCVAGEFYESLNMGSSQNPRLVSFCRRIGEFTDDNGHGSVVASAVIMENNSSYGVGSAYNTTLLPIAINGSDAFNTFIIGEAIGYAVQKGARVINLSLGGGSYDKFIHDKIIDAYNAGVVVVVASGNCGNKTASTCGIGSNNTVVNPIIYPAAHPEALSIGATNYATTVAGVTRSNYSSYNDTLDFVVGVGDGSVSPSGAHGINKNGVYGQSYTGTSFAAPAAAGVVALGLSINPNLSPSLIKQLLIASTKDTLTAGFDTQTGYGLIDASSFLSNVINPNYQSKYDFSGDGVQDLLFQKESDGALYGWYLNHSQKYEFHSDIANPNNGQWKIISVADINDDGFTDALLRNSVTNELYIWFIRQGKYLSGRDFNYINKPGSEYKVLGLRDFNNDGVEDILFQNKNNGLTAVWYLNTSGLVVDGKVIANPNNPDWEIRGFNDVNNNAIPDIVLQNKSTNKLYIWFFDTNNNYVGGSDVVNEPSFALPIEWKVVDLITMNEDTVPDIVFRNTQTGAVNYWSLNTSGIMTAGYYLANPNNGAWSYISGINYDTNKNHDILLMNTTTKEPYIWMVNSTGYYAGKGFADVNNNYSGLRVVGTESR